MNLEVYEVLFRFIIKMYSVFSGCNMFQELQQFVKTTFKNSAVVTFRKVPVAQKGNIKTECTIWQLLLKICE